MKGHFGPMKGHFGPMSGPLVVVFVDVPFPLTAVCTSQMRTPPCTSKLPHSVIQVHMNDYQSCKLYHVHLQGLDMTIISKNLRLTNFINLLVHVVYTVRK